ncbi:dephospho-CoA kinase [Candidatus Magnetoovum chiemensis]|nr:dephospho-CoA kinase [Candidatus Magnetoovum chiemensis]
MLIGLTGNFGSGKSAVLGAFKELGATVISADECVQQLLKTDEIIKTIALRLGDVLDNCGKLDKKKIANIVFNDTKSRKTLEAILHPPVMNEIRQIGKNNAERIVVAEIPLLFEGGYTNSVDKIITVTCQRDIAVKRLLNKGFTAEEIDQRLNAQIPDIEKTKLSHFTIDNSFNFDNTFCQAKFVIEKLKEMCYSIINLGDKTE